ncbi:MAG: hypothetical protein ACOCQR_03850 [bacterium]
MRKFFIFFAIVLFGVFNVVNVTAMNLSLIKAADNNLNDFSEINEIKKTIKEENEEGWYVENDIKFFIPLDWEVYDTEEKILNNDIEEGLTVNGDLGRTIFENLLTASKGDSILTVLKVEDTFLPYLQTFIRKGIWGNAQCKLFEYSSQIECFNPNDGEYKVLNFSELGNAADFSGYYQIAHEDMFIDVGIYQYKERLYIITIFNTAEDIKRSEAEDIIKGVKINK